MKQWWIFKGRSNFYSELVLDDECEKEVRARPEGFYDVVSESDTAEGGIHVVEYAEYEKMEIENSKLKELVSWLCDGIEHFNGEEDQSQVRYLIAHAKKETDIT